MIFLLIDTVDTSKFRLVCFYKKSFKVESNKWKCSAFYFTLTVAFVMRNIIGGVVALQPVPRVACYGSFAPYITVICLFVRTLLITRVPFPHSPPCCTHYLVVCGVSSQYLIAFSTFTFLEKRFNVVSYVCSTYLNISGSTAFFL